MLNNWSVWLQAPLLHIIVIMKSCWIWWSVCVCVLCVCVRERPLCLHLSSVRMQASAKCVCVLQRCLLSQGLLLIDYFFSPPRYRWIKQTCDPYFITLFILLFNWALETGRRRILEPYIESWVETRESLGAAGTLLRNYQTPVRSACRISLPSLWI